MTGPPETTPGTPRRQNRRRFLNGWASGCGSLFLVVMGLGALLIALLSRVPNSYPVENQPLLALRPWKVLGGGLDGFDSPYLGHTGSWNGKGGSLLSGSKEADLDKEVAMGLRWTFMPVYWRAMERDGPVDLDHAVPKAWQQLDGFVMAAQARQLNILMQAPVVGGNAGGPPSWAGRRERGRSAPRNMDALVAFAAKLAERYRPGGTLARQQGWGNRYGVRAWELDNEPEGYFTCWQGQAGDYAEFVTRASEAIRARDAEAVIVAPGLGGGEPGLRWLAEALSGSSTNGSPDFRVAGRNSAIGPVVDVISFHNYEGLDSVFAGRSRTIGTVYQEVRNTVKQRPLRASEQGDGWTPEYWHTEGNYDFLGLLSAERRAAWRFQFFTRAFAAGIRKVCVMDASPAEQQAVRAYVRILSQPWPMQSALDDVQVLRGAISAFRHRDGTTADAGQVWILWPEADTGDAIVRLPMRRSEVEVINVSDHSSPARTSDGWIRIELKGDSKMAPGVLVVDRPGRSAP